MPETEANAVVEQAPELSVEERVLARMQGNAPVDVEEEEAPARVDGEPETEAPAPTPETQDAQDDVFNPASLFEEVVDDSGNVVKMALKVGDKRIEFEKPEDLLADLEKLTNVKEMQKASTQKYEQAAAIRRQMEADFAARQLEIRQQAEAEVIARLKPQLDQLEQLRKQQITAKPLIPDIPEQRPEETDDEYAARKAAVLAEVNQNLLVTLSQIMAEAEARAKAHAESILAEQQKIIQQAKEEQAVREYEAAWFDQNDVPEEQRATIHAKAEALFGNLGASLFEGKSLGDLLSLAKTVFDAEQIKSQSNTTAQASATQAKQLRWASQVQKARGNTAPAPMTVGAEVSQENEPHGTVEERVTARLRRRLDILNKNTS